jgi:hypothetical protein
VQALLADRLDIIILQKVQRDMEVDVASLLVPEREAKASDRVFVAAQFPAALANDLRELAAANDRSVSAELRRAVASYLSEGPVGVKAAA